MCIVSREMRDRRDLIRLVFDQEQSEWFVDLTNRRHGRGYYISSDLELVEQAEKRNILGHLASNKKADFSHIYAELREVVEQKELDLAKKNREKQVKRFNLKPEDIKMINQDK